MEDECRQRSLHRGFYIQAIEQHGDRLALFGLGPTGEELRVENIDEVIAATGSRPDLRWVTAGHDGQLGTMGTLGTLGVTVLVALAALLTFLVSA